MSRRQVIKDGLSSRVGVHPRQQSRFSLSALGDYRFESRVFCASLAAASIFFPMYNTWRRYWKEPAGIVLCRPALISHWGPFRLPGSAASSAIGYTTASWRNYIQINADQESLP